MAANWALVAHGGAGVIERRDLRPEQERVYREAMGAAAETGAAVLRAGGRALDAAEAAVRALEDEPLFNAGRGSVFTAEGRVDLAAPGKDLERRGIRMREQIGLERAGQALDGRSVEPETLGERAFHLGGGDRHGLQGADHVGEPQTYELDAAFLDGAKHEVTLLVHLLPFALLGSPRH